ncbi:MAG: hypothetical protein VYD57_09625 [Pseudomonadota bacterium]|nr:hypothetical protein [Pseudomonadota bacterium]
MLKVIAAAAMIATAMTISMALPASGQKRQDDIQVEITRRDIIRGIADMLTVLERIEEQEKRQTETLERSLGDITRLQREQAQSLDRIRRSLEKIERERR